MHEQQRSLQTYWRNQKLDTFFLLLAVMRRQVDVARKNCYCLDIVCFVGPNQWISSSHASSSRNVLCGKRLTRSWKLMASVFAIDTIFFGLGKGTQVLRSTSNKRGTLCDPDNIFHANALSSRFSFLKQHTWGPKKNTTFHSRTLVFARPLMPARFTCCPMPPRSGLMNLSATFSK